MGKLWFKKSEATDEEIRSKFGSLIKKAKGNELNSWDTSPKGSLALLILLDQFTRNAFRDAPEAFASVWAPFRGAALNALSPSILALSLTLSGAALYRNSQSHAQRLSLWRANTV